MRSAYASIAAMLVAVFGVLAGNGVLTTLVPVRAEAAGFAPLYLGLMGSAYFFGMLAGASLTPWLVLRLGHIRAFGLSSLLGAGMIALLPTMVHPLAWVAMRGICGFFLAGIYAIVESYLQGKAENRIRGRLLAIYSVVQYGGWALGNQLMRLGKPTSFVIFDAAATIVVVFLIPLLFVRDDAPAAGAKRARMNLVWLYRTSPLGFICVTLIGFANGPFWSLTPVYATGLGMGGIATGTLVSAITIGAAIFQFPVGRISDAVDRRLVLIGLATLTAAFEFTIYIGGASLKGWPFTVIGFIMGGIIATQYYVNSAYTNDLTGRGNAVGVSAALLFLYCIGAILGPITASFAMGYLGPGALYLHNGGIHVAIAVFVMLRVMRAPPPRHTQHTVSIPAE